jgi:uncharacterized protein YjbI with pentapeptide repeats
MLKNWWVKMSKKVTPLIVGSAIPLVSSLFFVLLLIKIGPVLDGWSAEIFKNQALRVVALAMAIVVVLALLDITWKKIPNKKRILQFLIAVLIITIVQSHSLLLSVLVPGGFGIGKEKQAFTESESVETTEKDAQGNIIIKKTTVKTSKFDDGKTLWDWLNLLGVPTSLAILAYWLQQLQQKRSETLAEGQRKIAADETKEEVLQVYFDRLSVLLVDKNLLEIAAKDNHTQCKEGEGELLASAMDVIRARTLSILRRFENDPERKTSVINFLIETDIISKLSLNLSGADFSGADLRNVNLRNVILRNVILRGADLRDADLRNVILRDADLRDADLRSADLRSADLRSADLQGSNLFRANFRSANLRSANLNDANLFHADLSGVDLRDDAKLNNANFSGVNLNGANLSGAYLVQADLSNTDLSNADLFCARLSLANLCDANLSDANLSDASLFRANLHGANLRGADLFRANLVGTKNLTVEQLATAKLWHTKLPKDIEKDRQDPISSPK